MVRDPRRAAHVRPVGGDARAVAVRRHLRASLASAGCEQERQDEGRADRAEHPVAPSTKATPGGTGIVPGQRTSAELEPGSIFSISSFTQSQYCATSVL